MGFFDHIFDLHDEDDYAITGLNKELTCINIYDTFIRNNNLYIKNYSIFCYNINNDIEYFFWDVCKRFKRRR